MKPAWFFTHLQNNLFVIFLIIIFVGFVSLTIWGKDGVLDLMGLKAKNEQIVRGNRLLLRENWQLLQEIKSLNNPDYLEQVARQELGLVRASEEVYSIKD